METSWILILRQNQFRSHRLPSLCPFCCWQGRSLHRINLSITEKPSRNWSNRWRSTTKTCRRWSTCWRCRSRCPSHRRRLKAVTFSHLVRFSLTNLSQVILGAEVNLRFCLRPSAKGQGVTWVVVLVINVFLHFIIQRFFSESLTHTVTLEPQWLS